MNKIFFALLGFSIVALVCKAELPELAPVPNPGRWTIRLAPPLPDAKERAKISEEVWVLGTNRYEVTTWNDGRQGQLYVSNTIGFEKSPTTNDVYILDPTIAGAPAPPPVAAWREFSWIRPELAKGKTTYAKKSCLLYEEQTETGLRSAWIDEASRLPVALLSEGKTYLYEFQKPPDRLPGIDAVLGGTLKGYEAGLKKLSVDLKPR